MTIDPASLPGMKVTVMGLGVNGGGLASALFFARRGARVTVTDLRGASVLKESVDRLREYPVRFVLEHHEEADFAGADLVIKNPAVAPTSPFLVAARAGCRLREGAANSLALMQSAGAKLPPPVPTHAELMQNQGNWRAAWWPPIATSFSRAYP